MKKNLLYSMALLALVAACSSDGDAGDGWNGEIRLTARPATVTRAAASVQDVQFSQGQRVAVFISEHDYDAEADDRTDYTQPLVFSVTDDAGTLQPYGSATPYFPTNTAHGVDVYATYPATVTGTGTFSVKAQQSEAADYMASDLMHGTAEQNILRSAVTVPLTFRHQLAKVVVRLEAGSGVALFSGATVRLLGLKTQVPITACSLDGMTLGEATGTATDIVMTYGYDYDADHPELNTGTAAVVVPQTVGEGRFIRITLTDGTTMNYRLREAVTFEAGKVYTYVISLYQSSLSVRGEVATWNDGEAPISGTITTE